MKIIIIHVCMLSRVQIFVSPWTVACQAPLSTGFSWKWVGMPFSRDSSWPRDWTHVSGIGGFTTEPPGTYLYAMFFYW